jgi:hypothetical protein
MPRTLIESQFTVGYHEYDRNAITHVMACSSLFPGKLVERAGGSW